jgi:hypothetical protein
MGARYSHDGTLCSSSCGLRPPGNSRSAIALFLPKDICFVQMRDSSQGQLNASRNTRRCQRAIAARPVRARAIKTSLESRRCAVEYSNATVVSVMVLVMVLAVGIQKDKDPRRWESRGAEDWLLPTSSQWLGRRSLWQERPKDFNIRDGRD